MAFSSALAPRVFGNTELDVPNGTTDLTTLGAGTTSDLTFVAGAPYSPTSFTDATALTLGTLDDVDATDLLTIAGAGGITLNGGTNSLPQGGTGPEATTDALYVASGGTLTLSGTPLTIASTLLTATIDVPGTVNFGTLTTTAANVYTLTGGGTYNFGVASTANAASFTVSSGTIVYGAQNAVGGTGTTTLGGTITLGAATSANATFSDSVVNTGTTALSSYVTNNIVVPAGNTGKVSIIGTPSGPGSLFNFAGTIQFNSPLTIGAGGNTGTSSVTYQISKIVSGTGGTLTIDPGSTTVGSLPDVVLIRSANTFVGNYNVVSGVLRDTGSSNNFKNIQSLTLSAGTQFDMQVGATMAGLQDGTGTGLVTNNGTASNINLSFNGTTATTYSYTGSFVAGSGAAVMNLTTGTAFTGTQLITANDAIPEAVTTTGAAGTLSFVGNDTVAGAVTAAAGTLSFAGNNTFASTVSVGSANSTTVAPTGGTLVLNGTNTFNGTPAAPTVADGTLSTNNLQLSGTASGIGTLSTLALGNTQTYTVGTLTTTAAPTPGTLLYTGPTTTTNLIVTGFLGAGTFAANASTGNLNMSGTGTLTLTGQSTYSGTTTLASGTLNVGVAETPGTSGPIGNGGTISFTGGKLQFSSVNQYDYSSRFSVAASQAYNIGTNGQNVTFASPLVSLGGSLTVSDSLGTGSLTLAGTNTFSGTVTVNSGDLILGNSSALGSPRTSNTSLTSYTLGKAATTVNAGALDLNGNSISGLRLNLTGTGNNSTGALINSGGAATIGLGGGIGTFQVSTLGSGTTSNGSATIAATGITGFAATGSIGVDSLTTSAGTGYTNSGTVSVTGGGGTGLTISTSLSSGGIVFTITNPGTGYTSLPTLTLNSPVGGTGAAIAAAALGLTGVTVTSFGTANAGYSLSTPPTLTVTNSGLATNPTIVVDPVEVSMNGPLTIGGIGNITINDPITQTVGQNDGITKTGLNTLTLAGTSNYTGGTTINGGTLDVTGAIPNSATITVAAGTSSPTLILDGANAVLSTAPIIGTAASTSLPVITVNASQTLASIASVGTTNFNAGTIGVGPIDDSSVGQTSILNVNNSTSVTATHIRQGVLNIASGATVAINDSPAPGTTTATSVLTDLNNSGTLNLQNNDLIIKDSTQFAAVQAAITNAYHGGAWNQAGITSSSAAAHSNAYGLGYSTPAATGTTTFDGQTGLASGTVLVKYTLLGDTKLTGTVGLGDYNTVLANLNTGTLWSQGAFHPGTATGLGDYNAVLANFNVTASGSVAAPSVKSAAIKAASITLSPAVTSNAATDMKLQVNTLTGDVFAVATTAVSLTGYDIFDSSNNLKDSGDPNTDLNELLLSQPTTNRGNTTTFRNATNYKLWTTILDNASTLAEGENNGKLKQGTASTYDTINVPSGGTIDFGHVYATATNKQDLTFSFSEADPTNAGNPVTGTTYGAEVDYVNGSSTPEPGMLGLLGLGGVTMMRRRRGASKKGNS